MFGLFLFLVIFVSLCLFISDSRSSSDPTQVTKAIDYTPKPVRTKAGAIPVRGFKPVGLLGQAQNRGVKSEETESFVASENNIQHPQSLSSPDDTEWGTETEEDAPNCPSPSDDTEEDDTDLAIGGVAVAGGAAAGAGVVAAVGNLGLVGAFGGIGIGMAPVAVAGGAVGAAGYGIVKGFQDQDAKALGFVGAGAGVGVGAAALVGNMGLAMAGGAVAVGAAPVIAVGAAAGMAVYGFWRMLGGR
jgi:hypothetical protein